MRRVTKKTTSYGVKNGDSGGPVHCLCNALGPILGRALATV